VTGESWAGMVGGDLGWDVFQSPVLLSRSLLYGDVASKNDLAA